jgi:hypothetical protein
MAIVVLLMYVRFELAAEDCQVGDLKERREI